jgi:hypothetical protein
MGVEGSKELEMTQENQPASRPMDSKGESGGGAYPNPLSKGEEKANFKGGRSHEAYYGDGQFGDEELGANPNAVSTEQQE